MEKTIFEKIASKEIPAFIVLEDDDFLAFLDNGPSVYGQTLVIPKLQKESYVFKHDSDFMNSYWEFIRKVALLLDEKLETLRTILIFEGFEVNHLHAKLYPILSLQEAENFNPRGKIDFKKEDAEMLIEKLK